MLEAINNETCHYFSEWLHVEVEGRERERKKRKRETWDEIK